MMPYVSRNSNDPFADFLINFSPRNRRENRPISPPRGDRANTRQMSTDATCGPCVRLCGEDEKADGVTNPAGQTKTSMRPCRDSLFHADPPPFLDWLQSSECVGQAPVPRARRTHDAVVVGVGLAVALPARPRRHRVGERGDAVAGHAVPHQLRVDDHLDAIVDVRVALVCVEPVKLGCGDEVENALDAASSRLLDVRVEPLDEPPALERGAADGTGVGDALANPLGVQVRPVGEVQEGVGVHEVAAFRRCAHMVVDCRVAHRLHFVVPFACGLRPAPLGGRARPP